MESFRRYHHSVMQLYVVLHSCPGFSQPLPAHIRSTWCRLGQDNVTTLYQSGLCQNGSGKVIGDISETPAFVDVCEQGSTS